jgi:glycosyltransferase involved in cell wall biosynthesis
MANPRNASPGAWRSPGESLRLAYFGRLDATKGVDLIIDALRREEGISVRLDIYGVLQPGCEAYVDAVRPSAGPRRRIP